jgi:hypothetical protein
MDTSLVSQKRLKTIQLVVFLVFIALFPFGQLLRIPVSFLYAFQPLDGVVFLIVLFCFLRKPSFPFFVYTTVFSVFFTFLLGFSQQPALWSQAFLYFFRLAIYLFLPFAFPRIRGPKFILNVFLLWGICITVFGWVQYFFSPDLRFLYIFGWDDHYFRLVSTFLDPTFTGLLLVLCSFVSFFCFRLYRRPRYLLLSFIFLLTTFFTYSRSSYLAFFIGFIPFLGKRTLLFLGMIVFVFVLIFPFLPRPGGEGVNLLRTQSVLLKGKNFSEGWSLFSHSPLFGVGYNYLCGYRTDSTLGHSCFGLDTSLLFLLVTTGVFGLVIFWNYFKNLYAMIPGDSKTVFLSCSIAIGVHSLFSNSLVYSWVLAFMSLLFFTLRSLRFKRYKK